MTEYDDVRDEMLYDCEKENVMAIDVDCQGLAALSIVGARLAKEFPITYSKYVAACIEGNKLGEVKFFEERGHRIALLFTTLNRIGVNKDTDDCIRQATEFCIETLEEEASQHKFSSGILNRHTNTWGDVVAYLGKTKLNWTIHRN